MSKNNFIEFPIVKKVLARTLGDSIVGLKPKSIEEVANGRKIVEYPDKYTDIVTISELKELILNTLESDKTLSKDWLEVSTSISMPFNIDKELYYKSYNTISIICYQPRTSLYQDIIRGHNFGDLDPSVFNIVDLEKMINEIKNN